MVENKWNHQRNNAEWKQAVGWHDDPWLQRAKISIRFCSVFGKPGKRSLAMHATNVATSGRKSLYPSSAFHLAENCQLLNSFLDTLQTPNPKPGSVTTLHSRLKFDKNPKTLVLKISLIKMTSQVEGLNISNSWNPNNQITIWMFPQNIAKWWVIVRYSWLIHLSPRFGGVFAPHVKGQRCADHVQPLT
jgi:hypothetical protein